MNICTWYLIRVDLHTPLLLSGVFKAFLAIRTPRVVTKWIFYSSPTLFSESFDSPSTWIFLNDVWKLPCTMFEDLNLLFHGVLLDPLIKDSCGPLINCDSYSTFDETSQFLAFPSSIIISGDYQLTISSNTTSLITCNFRMEGWRIYIFFVLRNIQWKYTCQLLGLVLISSCQEHARM